MNGWIIGKESGGSNDEMRRNKSEEELTFRSRSANSVGTASAVARRRRRALRKVVVAFMV